MPEAHDPGQSARAMSHSARHLWTPMLLAMSAAALLTACSGGSGGGDDGEGSAGLPLAPDDFVPSISPEDLIEPLVGERRLAPDAIEVDALALMPPSLPISEQDREQVAALLRSLQPLDPTLTSDHHDRWFMDNRILLERLEATGRPELGWAALHAFTNYPQRHHAIRRTLLELGARVSPNEAEPLLAELAFTYGHFIEDRSEALVLLAEVAPETFFAGAEAHIQRQGKPQQTAPNDEFFVEGWRVACERSGRSPVPMMAQVATNYALEPYARVIAVRSLGAHADDPRASGAIRTTLVESTGDGYLRRVSAQTVLASFPKETACALLNEVAQREADVNFARFLDVVIQSNCR
jgi:hypothetical protein